ncbi:5'/3'-nucleotidase SurE [Desulfovibrio ferrophilus]|uniref:5'-nucleotidase SurE n=1 Tax=Desulfovibrio ferrophilus TaxID=241368 RepID=A0A2Z6B086_9BACT|nr:5'/3'-nucleotidase SurE [Desulfovibrio ferrophilus]BBD08921.1 stationary-phase survival protein SurE [Desulfovibrio ferrophilus]
MHILLTNDDGIQAVGLRALDQALRDAGHSVEVVAPVSEQSAVGHAVTLTMPLKVKRFQENGFNGMGVNGTPVDCVKLGLTQLLDKAPDLVVSGINSGCNVGVDIIYSGTVSAATEGALMGLPALAVSLDNWNFTDASEQAGWAADFVGRMDWEQLPEQSVLNLNFPNCPLTEAKPLAVCRQTTAAYRDWYVARKDPRGRDYYWLEGEIPKEKVSPDTDRALLWDGHITLTPLRFNFTDSELLPRLEALAVR